jgi:hypothetical protein
MFIGAWVSGKIVEAYTLSDANATVPHLWQNIWLIPAIGAAVIGVIFIILFNEKE